MSGDGGKTPFYMLRWVNTRSEKWPWSEVTTTTVAPGLRAGHMPIQTPYNIDLGDSICGAATFFS